MGFNVVTRPTLATLVACSALASTSLALAHNSYLTAFNTAYPGSTLAARLASTTGSSCNVCHEPSDTADAGNCYKIALAGRLGAGRTIAQAIADIDTADSDNDGFSNHVEILMARTDLPGQVGFNPGLIGATGTDPCAANPAAPVTGARETPLPPCLADFDHSGAVAVPDIFAFLSAWFAGNSSADIDGANGISVPDIFAFLSLWFAGC